MKLLVFFLTITCLQVSATGYSQEVTLKKKNASLEKVFEDIYKQTGYQFVYTFDLMNRAVRIDIDAKGEPLEDVLKTCFKDQPFTYVVIGKAVILKKKEQGVRAPAEVVIPIEVSGKVTDSSGSPLIGVTVKAREGGTGTVTDADGHYTISVQDDAVLIVSYVGYQMKEVPVEGRLHIDIILRSAVSKLSQLVVVGYGTQQKKDVTGSLSQIKTNDLTAYPTTNVVQALAGRATGVQVIQNDGSPGSPISVRIRGTNSIQGSNEPLYVIDGFPISGNPVALNSADIESVDILKDASATAIYGSRGANGVVLITTKQGKKGATKVSYEGSYSIQTIRKKLKLMTPLEYGRFYNEQAKNDGVPAYFTDDQLSAFSAMGKGTDWQDIVMRHAPMQNHTVNVSGGNDKTQFFISGSILKQDGIVINSYFNRYSFLANMKHKISDKFSVEYNINANRIDENDKGGGGSSAGRGNSLFSGMISVPPSLSPYNEAGSFTVPILEYPFISNAMINPLNYIYAQSNKTKNNIVLGNAAVVYKPASYLTVRVSGGFENSDRRYDSYTTHQFINSDGSAVVSATQYLSLLNENTITFARTFGDHDLSVLGGFTYQSFLNTSMGASGSGFVSDIQETSDLGAAAISNPASSGYSKSVLMSYLGRINYAYKNKYLFTTSFRADGSSKYGVGHKWGYFPSGAVAWRVSEEHFMKPFTFISDLKLRSGFGATGSQAISPYTTLNQLFSGKTVFDDALYTTYAPGTRLSSDLKWETTLQSDFGLDISFLNNRISLTADYYIKNTKDLLNNVQLPASLGYTYTIQNVGKIQNKGIELGVDANLIPATHDLQWNIGGNISFNRNKVVKLYGGQDIYGASYYTGAVGDFVNLLREGQPVGIFYGYVEDGYDSKGNITYKDLNHDDKITNEDKTYIGNPNPKYVYGFNSELSWKSFKIGFFFQGSQGNDLFNFSATESVDLNQGMNLLEDQYLHHWSPSNPDPNAKYPSATRSLSVAVSNRFVEEGSYLRLKTVRLTYNLPVGMLWAKWLTDCQIYVSGQNLLTWTKYSWYDPEISSHMSDNSINLGIDQYSYPTARSITFGIHIGL